MKKLSELELFHLYNEKSNLINAISKVALTTDTIDEEMLNDHINSIQRRFNFGLKGRIMEDYYSGYIVPVYNKEKLTIANTIPVFPLAVGNRAIFAANLSNKAAKRKDGNLEVDTRVLFTYMQTASIYKKYHYSFNELSMNATICNTGGAIFAKLVRKVLDRDYGINMNPFVADIVSYLSAKFFVLFQMGRADNETTSGMAYKAITNGTSKNSILEIEKGLSEDKYTSAIKFIEALSKLEGLGRLNFRTFAKSWITMFGDSSALAIEFFPFFCHMIFSAMVGAHINRQEIIEVLVGRETASLYTELSRIMR